MGHSLSNYYETEPVLDSDCVIPVPRKRKFENRNLCEISIPTENGLLWCAGLCFLLEARFDYYIPSAYSYISSVSLEDIELIQSWFHECNVFVDSSSYFTEELNNALECFKSLIVHSIENHSNNISNWRIKEGFDQPNFFDSVLDLVLSCFCGDTRDNRDIAEIIQEFYGKPCRFSPAKILKAIANIFDASVTYVTDVPYRTQCFIPFYQTEPNDCFCHLLIFSNTGYVAGKPQFSFGVDEAVLTNKQQEAIELALNLAREYDSECNLDISCFPQLTLELNLPDSLLQEKKFDFLLQLYFQPPYILEKLSSAAIQTNPTRTTFYFATLAKRFDVLFRLYIYSIYAPEWWVNSNRKFSSFMRNNLENINFELHEAKNLILEQKFTFSEKHHYVKSIDYLICISSVISDLISVYSTDEIIRPATNRTGFHRINTVKSIILRLIDACVQNFNTYGSESNSIAENCCSDHLIISLFFDHFYNLRSGLKLSWEQYEKIESAFYSMMYIENCTVLKMNKKFHTLFSENRKEFFNILLEFHKALNNKVVTKKTCVKKLHENELNVLKSDTLIRDQSTFSRLLFYLNVTSDLDKTKDKDIFDFVIQRCLQVLGETLKMNSLFSSSVIQSMIISTFPYEVTKHFCKIRDLLSHFDDEIIGIRSQKSDITFYSNIKHELVVVRNSLFTAQSTFNQFERNKFLKLTTDHSLLFSDDKNLKFQTFYCNASTIPPDLILSQIKNLSTMITAVSRPNARKKRYETVTTLNQLCSRYKELLEFWLSEFLRTSDTRVNNYHYLLVEIQEKKYSFKTADKDLANIATRNLQDLDQLKIKVMTVINVSEKNSYWTEINIPHIIKLRNILQNGEKKIVPSGNAGNNSSGNRVQALNFFKNRVDNMKRIIIKRVYKNNTHNFEADNEYTRQCKVLLRFMNDSAMKIALELLVCDCINLLQWRTDSKNIWTKTDGLYSGVDMRNVLCHINPSIEVATRFLDKYDVPNEIVSKVLEFVEDFGIIKALCELCNKTRFYRKQLIKLVQTYKYDGFETQRRNIIVSDRWKIYVRLIPKSSN